MNLSNLPLTLSATIKDKHLDSLGHMNVMWYLHFFDRATWVFYESICFGSDYHRSGFGSFAVDQHIRYLNELRAGDQISIFTRAIARKNKVFHLMHFMQRVADETLSCTMEGLGVHVDMSTRKSAPMPIAAAEAWDHHIEQHSKLDWEAPLSGLMK